MLSRAVLATFHLKWLHFLPPCISPAVSVLLCSWQTAAVSQPRDGCISVPGEAVLSSYLLTSWASMDYILQVL